MIPAGKTFFRRRYRAAPRRPVFTRHFSPLTRFTFLRTAAGQAVRISRRAVGYILFRPATAALRVAGGAAVKGWLFSYLISKKACGLTFTYIES